MNILNRCVLEHTRTMNDCSVNTTFCDPPYFLGTNWEYVDGKLQMKGEGKDFMGKWSINDADWWRAYFKELYRVMKFGGYVCMYSIDRQAWAFQSLMIEAGFEVCQTLYWATISNFPKASDAGKSIDKALGLDREVVGKKQSFDGANRNPKNHKAKSDIIKLGKTWDFDVTVPTSDLAKTFEGYKYGKAPLKKITEPLLVFRKVPKTGSVLNDLLAYQQDSEISPTVIDVENNRVALTQSDKDYTVQRVGYKEGIDHIAKMEKQKFNVTFHPKIDHDTLAHIEQGRFPATLFLNEGSAELLDSQLDQYTFELNGKMYKEVPKKEYEQIIWEATQNGTLKDLKVWKVERQETVSSGGNGSKFKKGFVNTQQMTSKRYVKEGKFGLGLGDIGYISRVMHKADFNQDDFDSFLNCQCAFDMGMLDDTVYKPTVSTSERNEAILNNHPTLKPVELNKYMLSLFRLPKSITQTLYIPFLGSGSEAIGALLAGYNSENIIGVEINHEFVKIAEARIAHYSQDKYKIGIFQ